MSYLKKIILPFSILISSSTFAQNKDLAFSYIEKYKHVAMLEQQRTGIPAAIKLAQGLHETAFGQSELCQNANNHFGIKCKATWKGETYTYTDDRKDECFRKYNDDLSSYKDHSDFLKTNPRYSQLFTYEISDYKAWAHGLKKAGYATNPQYAIKLIETIEKYNLNDYTTIAMNSNINNEILLATNTTNNIIINEKENEPSSTISLQSPQTTVDTPHTKEYYVTTKLNNLKGFWAPKGTMLLEYAIKNKIRYSKLLENNEIPDAPLEADMFIYLDKKLNKGLEANTIVGKDETLLQISQRTGVSLTQLRTLNKLVAGVEPKPGTTIELQEIASEAPEVYITSRNKVNNTVDTRKVNADDNYIIVKNTSKEIDDILPIKENKAISNQNSSIDINTPVGAKIENLPAVETSTPATIEKTIITKNEPQVNNSRVVATQTIEEDLSHLSPYERLKRHMEKQVSNQPEDNTAYFEKKLKEQEKEMGYIVTPTKNDVPSSSTKINSGNNNSKNTSKAVTTTKYYTVKKGETLHSIATKHKVTVKELQSWNKVSPKSLKVGQKLKVSK
jgi:LysM repeat protein